MIKLLKKIKRNKEVRDWEKRGKTTPTPQLIKQEVVRRYGKRYEIDTLIETGTYMGDMIEAVQEDFRNIYSIELSEILYAKCKNRFIGDNSIFLFCGDSAKELPKILRIIRNSSGTQLKGKSRVLFWLDAHYSGGETARAAVETPIVSELKTILNHNSEHIILIDDAKCFNGEGDYPTLLAVEKFVTKFGKKMIVEDDIIRIN